MVCSLISIFKAFINRVIALSKDAISPFNVSLQLWNWVI